MQKRLLAVLFLFLLLIEAKTLQASHAMGADLSYQCIDATNRTYKVVLRFYRDCEGLPASPTILLKVSSLSCGADLSVNMLQVPCGQSTNGGQPCEVSPLCPSSILQSTCNGGTLPGVEAYTYESQVSLPSACPDWVFSISISSRNSSITNLANASAENLYVQATLNNTLPGCNNSPVFTSLPVPFICANQPFSYNHGAVDPDGDSLVYSLINPLGNNGVPINYNPPYTPNNPLNTTGAFAFDSLTGQLNFTPAGVQVAVITVLVQEYRNGILIGSTMRDIQVVVVNLPECANPTPLFSGLIASSIMNGIYVNDHTLRVCPEQNLAFSTLAVDVGNDSIYLETNIAQAIPGAHFSTHYISKDSVFGYFSWMPSGLDTGFNSFIIKVKNNKCPLSNNNAYALTIIVLPGTYAGNDKAYCPAGGPVQLQAYGGTQFNWSPATGLNNADISNPIASPAQTTTYIVQSNLSSSCRNKDTVVVRRVPDFNFSINPDADTICRFGFMQLHVYADSVFAPYQYRWTPIEGLNSNAIADPIAAPDSNTTYTLLITSDSGCLQTDSVKVTVNGQGPQVSLTADRYKACVGDTIHLSALVSPLSCGLNHEPCNGNYQVKAIGNGTITSGPTPYHQLFMAAHLQMIFPAAELHAQGMGPCTITDIAFNLAQRQSTLPYGDFTIKMGCTDQQQLSYFIDGLSTVLIDSSFVPTGTGYNTHTFTQPYDWDGISNLLVEICYTNFNYSQNDIVYGTRTAYVSAIEDFNDNTDGCILQQPNISFVRPNLEFVFCSPLPRHYNYNWGAGNNLTETDSVHATVVFAGDNTYSINVEDSACSGGSSVMLSLDSSFSISAGNEAYYCNGLPVQLRASVLGTPPTAGIAGCGTHNSGCNGFPIQQTFNPLSSFSSTNTPFTGGVFAAFEDERAQMLYNASDLLSSGFTPGTISQLGIKIDQKQSTEPFKNLHIKLGCTDKTDLSDSIWEPTTEVGNIGSYSTLNGWNDFPLQNSYDWDGVSNLVVEYCWDNPAGFPSNGQDQTENSLTSYSSLHIATAINSTGCSLPVPTFQLFTQVPSIRVKMCTAPTLPVTYQWSPAVGLSADTIAAPYALPQNSTTYYVTAYFGGKCPRSDSVIVAPASIAGFVSNDTGICHGQLANVAAGGGDTYHWSSADSLSCYSCTDILVSPDSTSAYYVVIKNDFGCEEYDTVTVFVQERSRINMPADTTVNEGTSVKLNPAIAGGTGSFVYNWQPPDYLEDAQIKTPTSTPLADVTYLFTVSSGLCTDTGRMAIHVIPVNPTFAVPDAFTPNGDGRNDEFFPVVINNLSKVKSMKVFNRWGQLLHNSPTPWDGKFNGTEQPAGTYLYYIVISVPLHDDKNIQGAVTLLR